MDSMLWFGCYGSDALSFFVHAYVLLLVSVFCSFFFFAFVCFLRVFVIVIVVDSYAVIMHRYTLQTTGYFKKRR